MFGRRDVRRVVIELEDGTSYAFASGNVSSLTVSEPARWPYGARGPVRGDLPVRVDLSLLFGPGVRPVAVEPCAINGPEEGRLLESA